ncbi:hypothetical protein R1flu_006046 [Riccia fluitans]|uniref:Uncharacterized protein n=1 Tax=Riccia fluitans TaxID=41844 RepID=A0ABD1YYZ0_9MARC
MPIWSGGKFRKTWFGPYVIIRAMKDNVIELENPDGEPIGKLVNVNRLKPYRSLDLPDVPTMPTPGGGQDPNAT